MHPVKITSKPGQVSDGYHTFDELYEHRYVLFCTLAFGMRSELYTWKSRRHWIEGELQDVWPGYFVAGIRLDPEEAAPGEIGKMITYHLPIEFWDLFYGVEEETPPPHDGHTSKDVIQRLKEWLKI